MLLVDPMHCLFLGKANYIIRNIWIKQDIIGKQSLDIIQDRIQKVNFQFSVGRIPSRIDSGVTFTAEQWMNWTNYLSIFCLFELISERELECWRLFVLACRKLCRKELLDEDIKIADKYLQRFRAKVKRLYGVTTNMHMACHIADCIYDYGPLHSFWLFAFERYNGVDYLAINQITIVQSFEEVCQRQST